MGGDIYKTVYRYRYIFIYIVYRYRYIFIYIYIDIFIVIHCCSSYRQLMPNTLKI